MRIGVLTVILLMIFVVVHSAQVEKDLPVFTYEIVKTYKHDSKAFTQGLVFYKGFLYEGTGKEGDSQIRKIELETGKVLKKKSLSDKYFGEGITIFDDKIYQLTWREKTAFVYDTEDFNLLEEIKYKGSGWGLTNDGKRLILSDGTDVLKFVNPKNFNVERTISVKREDGKPVYHLNELEYIEGEIWANIWHSEQDGTKNEHGFFINLGKSDYIARINPQTGKVVGWIDLANLSPDDGNEKSSNLNGIAYDSATKRIFVTGKNWKNLFEIKVKPKG